MFTILTPVLIWTGTAGYEIYEKHNIKMGEKINV